MKKRLLCLIAFVVANVFSQHRADLTSWPGDDAEITGLHRSALAEQSHHLAKISASTQQINYLMDSMKFERIWYDNSWPNMLYKGSCTYDAGQRLTDIHWQRIDSNWGNTTYDIVHYNYAYNATGQTTSWYEYSYESGNWFKTRGEEFTYNTANKLTQWKKYGYYNSYSIKGVHDYIYDTLDRVVKETYESWDLVHGDHNMYKTHYAYNSSGKVSADTQFYWMNNTWAAVFCTTYAYNPLSQIVKESIYLSSGSVYSWSPYGRNLYAYDSLGHLTEKSIYFYHSGSASWTPYRKYTYTYNQDNLMISFTWYNGNQDNSYTPYERYIYGYSPMGLVINTLIQYYNVSADTWDDLYLRLEIRDQHGNNTEIFFCTWDTLSATWDSSLLSTASFNQSIRSCEIANTVLVNFIKPPGFYFPGNTDTNAVLMRSVYEYMPDCQNPEEIHNYRYYYSSLTSGTTEPVSDHPSFTLYPNPVSDILHLDHKNDQPLRIEILDLRGRILLTLEVDRHAQVDLTDLKSGCYIYRANSKNEAHSGKLVVY